MDMQKEVLSVFLLHLKNPTKNFQNNTILCNKYLDNIKSKISEIFWVTTILRLLNLSFLSLYISTKFDQFVQFVILFQSTYEKSILDDVV